MKAIEIIDEANLDYITNRQRKCECNCDSCEERNLHSVENCEIDCKHNYDYV